MNILILEENKYLSQKIMEKIFEIGHNCIYCSNIAKHDICDKFDIVLLSLDYDEKDINRIIKLYYSSVIIFLGNCNEHTYIKYISTNIVSDYVSKPFVINELIRKIYHYNEFNNLNKSNKMLDEYKDFINKQSLKILKYDEQQQFELITIDNYIKNIIIVFQNKLTDTEISIKLGISRKTLWAKRKKLEI